MSRSKSKIAVTLLGALAFGANAQAMNSGVKDVKSEQTIGAVGGARNQHKKTNWQKIAKIGVFSVAGLAALETIRSIIGGVTDSKLGSFSIGRAIRNRIKKNGVLDEILKKFQAVGELSEENKKMLIQCHKNVFDSKKIEVKSNSNETNNFLNFMKTGKGNVKLSVSSGFFVINGCQIVFGIKSNKYLLTVVNKGNVILRILK